MEDDASRSVADKINQRRHSYKCQYRWFYKNNFNKKKCSKMMLLQVSLLTLFNYDTFKVSLKTLIKMALHRSVIVD